MSDKTLLPLLVLLPVDLRIFGKRAYARFRGLLKSMRSQQRLLKVPGFEDQEGDVRALRTARSFVDRLLVHLEL